MGGVSSRLSLTDAGSLMKAEFGAESADGVGAPEFEVTHNIPSGSVKLVAIQPAGNAGTVTPSKFSKKMLVGLGHGGAGVGVGLGGIVAVAVPVAVAVAVADGEPVAVAVAVAVAV